MVSEGSERLRLALVGCGGIAKAHVAGIEQVATRIEVTAVVDPDPGRRADLADRTGAAAFPTLDRAITEAGTTFDAVDILVPHDAHESVVTTAIGAGKHVLLEKPLGPDLASSERILSTAAGREDLVFLVAEQSQFWPDVVEAARLIDRGAIGRVLFARACYRDPWVLPRHLADDEPAPWRFRLDRAGGGLAVDGGAHWIRPLRMMLGEVDAVVAVTGRHVERMEGESWLQALLRFRSGITASFEAMASTGAMASTELFRITGTEGELVIPGPAIVDAEHRLQDAELRLHDADHPDGTVVLSIPEGRGRSYGLELADFAAAVLDGAAPAATAAHSLGELRTALAINRSARSGAWEPVWDDGPRA